MVCKVRCERRYINLVTGDYVNTCDAVGCKCWLSEFPNANMLCSTGPSCHELPHTDTNINTDTQPQINWGWGLRIWSNKGAPTRSVRMQNICINDLRSDRCQRSNLSFIAQTRPSIKLRKILGVGGQCSVLGHRQDYVDRKCRVLKRRQAVSSVLPVNRKNRIVLHITTISISTVN